MITGRGPQEQSNPVRTGGPEVGLKWALWDSRGVRRVPRHVALILGGIPGQPWHPESPFPLTCGGFCRVSKEALLVQMLGVQGGALPSFHPRTPHPSLAPPSPCCSPPGPQSRAHREAFVHK